jgi:hypothetical protein|nr:DUF2271 domain-containing protein [uncultured Rhodoferax sp.]
MTMQLPAPVPRVRGWGHVIATSVLALAHIAPGSAASLTVELTLPGAQSGATYYRPYLAVWIENAQDQSVATTLAVWYDQRLRNDLGKMWLRNLRTWWRKAGESMELPADGVSGATRVAGKHLLRYETTQANLAKLPAGDYNVAVEVAREQGGRELVRAPFHWHGASVRDSLQTQTQAQGSVELGDLVVRVLP